MLAALGELPHDCKDCGRDSAERSEMEKAFRAAYGCDGPTPHQQCDKHGRELWIENDDGSRSPLRRCPMAMMDEGGEDWDVIRAIRYFCAWSGENGTQLPCAGGVMSQPATFNAAIRLMNSIRNRVERERNERALSEMRHAEAKRRAAG